MPITSKQYTELKTEIEEIKVSLEEIRKAIIGNPAFGQEGLVDMVKKHEDYIENDRRFKQKLIGGGVVFGSFWTVLIKWGHLLFEKI
jgi:hypothetical protein